MPSPRMVSLQSVLILTILISLDIKVRKPAYFYEAKSCKYLKDTFLDRELKELDFHNLNPLVVVGPHIYTDDKSIEGKVGAALTEWRDGKETWISIHLLHSFCTIFQTVI
ncbi:hypothetical protein EVAR_48800_1 [Eumeta japonica]|uniref:Uncharacterized protein n=1 Tax=Eumeta variegata TaxID=151549 RepID=A0A4C1Y226_EUMVA|nr:hypothetical protein EVAR_48800_1 [Eumeta japonica]